MGLFSAELCEVIDRRFLGELFAATNVTYIAVTTMNGVLEGNLQGEEDYHHRDWPLLSIW